MFHIFPFVIDLNQLIQTNVFTGSGPCYSAVLDLDTVFLGQSQTGSDSWNVSERLCI